MITARLRTLIFVLACAVLAFGLWVLLHRMRVAPPTDLDGLTQYAQRIMADAGKGLSWVLVGAFIVLLVVLWNSSALSKNWLDVLGYAFKGFGVLVTLLLAILFLRQQQLQEVVATTRATEAATAEKTKETERKAKETEDTSRERNRERVSTFLRQLSERDVPGRKIAVTVAASYLRDEDVITMSLVQALYATALYDADESVRACARNMLFPMSDTSLMDWASPDPDFAPTVVQLLQAHPELLKRYRYLRYAGLLRKEYSRDGDLMSGLASAESAKSEELWADKSTQSALQQPTPTATPEHSPSTTPFPNASPTPLVALSPIPSPAASPNSMANRDEAARRVLMMATYADSITSIKALDLLAAADESRLREVISSLPPEVRPAIPPRVYIHVPDPKDADSKKLGTVRKAIRDLPLGRAKNQTRTIVPKTIVDTTRVPASTEVRCYEGEESLAMAKILTTNLIQLGFPKAHIFQDKPTTADRKETREISSHFEIWFAKGDLK
jgi:hypothetical protein